MQMMWRHMSIQDDTHDKLTQVHGVSRQRAVPEEAKSHQSSSPKGALEIEFWPEHVEKNSQKSLNPVEIKRHTTKNSTR